jgi:hypothetical protein
MKKLRFVFVAVCLMMCGVLIQLARAQVDDGVDPEALIERILAVEQQQRGNIRDVTFDAEYVEGEEKDGEFRERVRFVKKIYIKYLADTALYYEDYLEYYKDGELQSEKERDNEAKDRKEKKAKRNARDISFSMLEPFQSEQREFYDIEYRGAVSEPVEGYMSHHFRVTSKEETDTRINGDFYFDVQSFQLVRVDFSPAKLVKKAMFRLKEMFMSIIYGPTDEGLWLPRQFDIAGRGKAMFFIGVTFAGTEYYRNPVINSEIGDEIFEVNDGN